ncbi:TadE family type IV pilus minor pilin [Pilimelia terevasa]|nr:TadE family type IV pilus minor pilin [Pilimelia terevasa]
MFTAELAAGLPALVLLLGVGLTAVDAVRLRVWCLHAARESALAQSRGRTAPPWTDPPVGAALSATADDRTVRIRVQAPVRVFGASVPRVRVAATAVASWEPGVAPRVVPAAAGRLGMVRDRG